MPSKHRSSIIKDQDVAGPVLVVGSDLEVADFTSLVDALANLPPGGGTIKLLEGTFSFSSTIVMPAKPVRIEGQGSHATVLAVSGAIALFTLSGGSFRYEFAGFRVTGTGVAGQRIWDITAGVFERILLERITSSSVEKIVTMGGTITPEVWINDCDFFVPTTAASRYFDRPGVATGGEFHCSQSRFRAGITGGGTTGAYTIFSNSCLWDIDNGMSPLAVFAVDSVFREGTITVGAAGQSILEGCRFTGEATRWIDLASGSSRSIISACLFEDPVVGTDMIRIASVENVIVGCILNGAGAAARGIDVLAGGTDLVVAGCRFGTFTGEGLRTASTGAVVTGNHNLEVLETGAANLNSYSNNTGFTPSTIIGADSRVEGSLKKGVTGGATTGAFVDQFTHTNPKGVVGVGTIKNTGGVNALEVRETAIDAFGVTDSLTSTVAAGASAVLDSTVSISTARPPYTSYTVAVRHPVAATTFDLQFTDQGARA